MKKMINRIFCLLLIFTTAAIAMPLHGLKTNKGIINTRTGKVEPLEHVAKEVSILDQIVEQAERVVKAKNDILRSAAKEELIALMRNEDLDDKIKEAIIVDIEVINISPTQTIRQKAYNHLLTVVVQINAQAEAVAITEQATELIKIAPEKERPGLIQRAYQKIQEATEYAKSIVTTPVNYVFGEESSSAKTAFYATAGALILYGAYYQFKNANERAQNERAQAQHAEWELERPERERQAELKRIASNERDALADKIKEITEQQEYTILLAPSTKTMGNNTYWVSTEELDKLEALRQDLIKQWKEKGGTYYPRSFHRFSQ